MATTELPAAPATTRAPRANITVWLSLALAGLGVAALLIVSELLLALFPVSVQVQSAGSTLSLTIDGQTRTVQLAQPIQGMRLLAVDPLAREYQIDGSDTTNNFTYSHDDIAAIAQSPYYRFQSWLRDDGSYSRWQNLSVRNGAGAAVIHQARPASGTVIALPQPFALAIALHRPEIPRTIELEEAAGGTATITLNRNDKYVQVSETAANGASHELAKAFFPVHFMPWFAEVAYLLMRACALGLALLLILLPVAAILPKLSWRPGTRTAAIVAPLAATVVLGAACYTAVALFAKAPHILDAVSYYVEGKIMAGGALAVRAPPEPGAFPIPFMVVHAGKWFTQYPPGTPLVLAVGLRIGLAWLVEPVLAAVACLLIFGSGRRQFGIATALLAVVLVASSPFQALMAGSYLSHVPALCFAAVALYAATRYLEAPKQRWAVLGAAALGMTFLTREVVAIIYGVVLTAYAIVDCYRQRRARWLEDFALAATVLGCFLALYLLYNRLQTGSAFTDPRVLFDPRDRWGFGEGIGFYGRHTPGAGLVNTDGLLTSLSFMLFGWPFYFSLALMALPFLLRRARSWDVAYGAIVALFILAYDGLYYHGIALGPRYYFEALPAMALLTARGFACLAGALGDVLKAFGREGGQERGRTAVLALSAALLACNLVFFVPRQLTIYHDYSGLPGRGGPALGSFVQNVAVGRVSTLSNAIVATSDWWLFNAYFAALDCPRLDCGTIFVLTPNGQPDPKLQAAFPGRDWYTVVDEDGRLEVKRVGG